MRQELADARALLIQGCAEKGMSQSETATRLNLSSATIYKYAKLYSIEFSERLSREQLQDAADKGMSRIEAAAHFGVCYQTIHRLARKHDITFPRTGTGAADQGRLDAAIAMYKAGKTLAEIGGIYGVSRERIRQILSKHAGMDRKDGGKTVAAAINRRERKRREEIKYMELYGCSTEQYKAARKAASKARMTKEPKKAPLNAFTQQKSGAKRRGIPWNLKFWDWWTVWKESGHWEERGRSADKYVMCRFGDTGGYEVGNVYIATLRHNSTVQPNNPTRKSHPDHASYLEARAA